MATFVFLHGGWSASWVWESSAKAMRDKGHKAYCLDLPGHGQNHSVPLEQVKMGDHVRCVEEFLAGIPEKVIMVAHSMSGMIMSQVAEDMPEKMEKIVYFAAFMPETDGAAMIQYILEDPWTQVGPQTTLQLPNGLSDFRKPYLRNLGFNTCGDEAFSFAESRLQLENGFLWTEPIHITERFESVPKVYVHTLKDNCCSYYMQRRLVKSHGRRASFYLDTDHFGMIAAPEETQKILLEIAEMKKE